jgi:glycosyltransferase involved in cell wall biosynthesis
MRSDPPQIVHTHLFKSDIHGRLAARLAGVPAVVSTLHNSDPWARQRLLGALYGATARFADRLIAVSDEVRDYHLKYTGAPASKIITIENGVDVQKFTGQASAGQVVRAELGIAHAAPLFGVIGRLKPQKDHTTFLLAAAEILRQLPEARFLIVGEGPLRTELEIQARGLGLEAALIFTGLRTDIPAVLAALDVLVFSSQWEGLPVTLLEGMAASRPVVATAVDGIRGVALPDVTALLVPPADPFALAAACVRLGMNRSLAGQMGEAGYLRVSAHYSLEAMIDRTADLYASLLPTHQTANLAPAKSARPGGAV